MIRILSAAGATALFAVSAQASFINVDLGSGHGTPTGPAVVGSAGDTWNNFNAPPGVSADLLNAGGGTSSVAFFMSNTLPAVDPFPAPSGNSGSFQYGTGDALIEDYIWMSNNGTAVDDAALIDGSTANYARRFTLFTDGGNGVVEDLDPNQSYNLYLYGSGDAVGQGAKFMLKQDDGVGGFTYTTLAASGVPWTDAGFTYVEGGNYVVFEGISPTAWNQGFEFELSWFNGQGAGGAEFAAFNGFQLEIVPEPGSLAGLAVGALILIRRRRA
ncbi:MAG: PEP-CTERM sorting domain-containing protein [Phycisphaeraceae bacterium]|nr:PEP-CTERM sorting domain-containing protein [Phycisphaeraceae bacterium]